MNAFGRAAFAAVAVIGLATACPAALEIPMAVRAPVIDGVSAPGEWDGALRLSDPCLHVGIFKATGKIDPRRCDVSVLWNETALYVRCRAETAPGNRLVLASGVHSVYMDDNFEFHFDPPAAFRTAETKKFGVFQLIVNAAGETFSRHENPGYGLPAAPWKLKGVKIANGVKDDVWTLEMSVPAKVLGGERFAPAEWGFVFTRNYRAGGFAGATLPAYAGGGYEKPESYARMALTDSVRGRSPSAPATDGFLRAKADVKWGDLAALVNPAELGGKEIDGSLKWYPSLNAFTLDLTVDAKRVGEMLKLEVSSAGCGRMPLAYSVPADARRIHRVVPVGRTLADGDYRMTLLDAKGKPIVTKRFRVKDYPWLHAKKGVETILLPGFTAPTVEGKSVSCVLRRYDLGENGFPRDVIAKGASILAAPIALWGVTGGARTDLGTANRLSVETPKDLAVAWRSTGPVYTLAARLEQDGLIRCDLDFAAPPECDRVTLEMRLRREHAILFHASGEGMRTNPAGFIPGGEKVKVQGEGEEVVFRSSSIPQNNSENFIPYCWFGADERGICFAADTDEGWLHQDEAIRERIKETGKGELHDAVELVRHPNGEVTLRVNLINGRIAPADLRRITFAIQASPVKARPAGWRGWSDGFDYTGTVNANGAWSPSQWGCFSDWAGRYPAFGDWSYIRRMSQMARDGLADRAYYADWIERVAKADAATAPWLAKMDGAERRRYVAAAVDRTQERAQQLAGKPNPILYPYTCDRELTKALAENAVMRDEWEESESVVVGGSYREYALYYLDKMIESGFNGVYDDNTYFYCNFSWATGDAWIDAKGDVHPSYGLWNSREYHRRQATVLVQHGHYPWITAHHTNANILPTLGFVANTMGMEWKYGTDDFQNRFTPDYIRAVCGGGQGGFYPTVLDGILRIGDRAERRRVTRTMLASLLPHEVRPTIPRQSDRGEVASVLQKIVDWGVGEPDCAFAGYWDAACPIAASDPSVLVSAYRRGDRYLAVCGSWATNDVTLALTPRGGAQIRRATDLETGRALDPASLALKRHDLALVEIDCGPDRALYVDNVKGDDANDGSAARPYKTAKRGLEALRPGGTLRFVANAEPYREGVLVDARHTGRPGAPTVIDGGGATIDGFVADAAWTDEGDGVFSTYLFNNAWPMNRDGHWCGAFPIVMFGRVPGVNVTSRAALKPGCYFLKKMKGEPDHDRLYVKLAPGTKPRDLPVWSMAYQHNVCLSRCANVRVRNFVVRNQPWDCFSVNYATNCVLENLDGGYAMDQGISSHSCVGIKVRKSRFHHNTGCGICDVNIPKYPFCSVSYDDCTIDHNSYRRPVEFYGAIPGKDAIPNSSGDFRMYNCRVFANDLSHADGVVIRHDAAARLSTEACDVQTDGEKWRREDPAKHWNFDALARKPECRVNPFPDSDYPGLRAFLVKGSGRNGKPAEFFVYYGLPEGSRPTDGFPAIVMVHGGGGTAFPNAIQKWTKAGFAVMALDWNNQRPSFPDRTVKPAETTVVRADLPGGKWDCAEAQDAKIANIVRTHSLLRTMPEVNAERIALVGLSWGSWYGAAVAAFDTRLKGVVEIYCGDVKRDSDWLVNGRFLHAAKVPMWWFVNPVDGNVTPRTLADGWDECGCLAGKTIVNELPHSHVGFDFDGCIRMARHFTLGEPPLPVLSPATVANGFLQARILNPGKGVVRAKIAWTAMDGTDVRKNVWHYAPAEIRGGVVRALVPEGAVMAYLAAYEEDEGRYHDFCGSSDFVDLTEK